MKQFQTIYKRNKGLSIWLEQIRLFCDSHHISDSSVLFHIFTNTLAREPLEIVLSMLHGVFPGALYAGVTSTGNIIHGSLVETKISLTCSVFEDPDTTVMVLQMPMTYETQAGSAEKLLGIVNDNPWVKGIEMLTTLGQVDMPAFCNQISAMPQEIQVYGGGAHALEVVNGDTSDTFVFSSSGDPSTYSAVFILMGGPDFHISTSHLTGWRVLGKPLMVTSASRNLLHELDGRPALEVYRHYLNVPTDDRFYRLCNEFPLLFDENGTEYLRVIASHLPDGSLKLGATVDEARSCCITYGDPVHIMHTVHEMARKIHPFGPQAIRFFSCAGRKFFWGPKEVSRETLPFEMLAPSAGFFTAGEIHRTGGKIYMHNITLVIAAMREGEAAASLPELTLQERNDFSHQLLVSSCLATFIQMQQQEIAENKGS